MLRYIVFAHVLGAVVWIGGMIMMRLAVHPALKELGEARIPFVISALKNSFQILAFSAAIMGLTGTYLMMSFPSLGAIVHIKSSVWIAMVIVLGFAIWKYTKALEAYSVRDIEVCKANFEFIAVKLMPINIAFGLLEIFMGVVLRGY